VAVAFGGTWFGQAAGATLGAEAALMASGWLLALSEPHRPFGDSFFGYRLFWVADLPAAFVAGMALLLLNGLFLFEWAALRGFFHTPRRGPWGGWGFDVPIPQLRVLALNLVAVPSLIGLFVLLRDTCCW
jgi:hypothetical protein